MPDSSLFRIHKKYQDLHNSEGNCKYKWETKKSKQENHIHSCHKIYVSHIGSHKCLCGATRKVKVKK